MYKYIINEPSTLNSCQPVRLVVVLCGDAQGV